MDADRRLTKALEAVNDALQHLSITPDFGSLDYTHIDRLLGRVADLPTENNQRNSRRNLLSIRQWMITESPGVALLEVLGQLYWRLGELNSKQFEKFKETLQHQQPYLNVVQNDHAVRMVVQRIRYIQRSKVDACQDFLFELADSTGIKDASPMNGLYMTRTRTNSPYTPPQSVCSQDTTFSQEPNHTTLTNHIPSRTPQNNDMEQTLTSFYINNICPNQSPTYTSLLHLATTNPSTRYALLSLSASYLSASTHPPQNTPYHQADLYYSTQALQCLTLQISNGENYEGVMATSMLLMQHAVLNQQQQQQQETYTSSPLCWSCHANILDIIPSSHINYKSDTALFLRAQIILARTAQKKNTSPPRVFETMEWLTGCAEPDSAREIRGTIYCSAELLCLIAEVTRIAGLASTPRRVIEAQGVKSQILEVQQWCCDTQGGLVEKEVLVASAEAFRLAALVYLRCRGYAFTPLHPLVQSLSSALHGILLSFPGNGKFYPVWPFFIACLASDAEERGKLVRHVSGGTGTLGQVIRWVSMLNDCEMQGERREGWWDDMLSTVGDRMGEGLLCLGSF